MTPLSDVVKHKLNAQFIPFLFEKLGLACETRILAYNNREEGSGHT